MQSNLSFDHKTPNLIKKKKNVIKGLLRIDPLHNNNNNNHNKALLVCRSVELGELN